jgi:hypothetical protein
VVVVVVVVVALAGRSDRERSSRNRKHPRRKQRVGGEDVGRRWRLRCSVGAVQVAIVELVERIITTARRLI